MKALKEAMSGRQAADDDEQVRETLIGLPDRAEDQDARQEQEGREAFLAENKKKEGIITTASGLQYKIETKGTGKVPKTNDTVVCHYRGTLIDGTEFDSSYKRSEPSSFGVTGVIKGWTEALLMNAGRLQMEAVHSSDWLTASAARLASRQTRLSSSTSN